MKKILLIFIFIYPAFNDINAKKKIDYIFKNISISDSVKNLRVRLIPQVRSKLCWAASVKMILDYKIHPDSTSLETIIKAKGLTKDAKVPIVLECNTDSFSKTTGKWNVPIVDSPNEFERVFSGLGYYSMEDSTTLSWNEIKNQIDNGRPLLLVIQEGLTDYFHAVVLKGYYEKNGVKYIIINDPWGACRGQRYSLNYDVLINKDPTKLIKLVRTTHNIYKKKGNICLDNVQRASIATDSLSSEESYLMHIFSVTEDTAKFHARLDSILGKLPTTKQSEMATSSNIISVNYINVNEVKQANKIEEAYQKITCKDIVFENENVVVRVQLIDGKWEKIKYSNNFYPKLNDENKITEYIVYPELYQAFFRFNKNGNQNYLLPQYYVDNQFNPESKLPTEKMFAKIKFITKDLIIQHKEAKEIKVYNQGYNQLDKYLNNIDRKINRSDMNKILPILNQIKNNSKLNPNK